MSTKKKEEEEGDGLNHLSLGKKLLNMVNGLPAMETVGKTTYDSSAGGGDAVMTGGGFNTLSNATRFVREELSRPQKTTAMMTSGHRRLPEWWEEKNVAIDGTPLPEDEAAPWVKKYRKELMIGEAIEDVRKQKRFEKTHDVVGFISKVKRWAGYAEPLSEPYAKKKMNARFELEEEAQRLAEGGAMEAEGDEEEIGVLRDTKGHGSPTWDTPWKVLLKTVETGRPLAKVAQEYRPRIDFYGLDPFLDSAPSFLWFCTKCGIGIGLIQGTVKTIQAANVDVQFLKASGVGLLSVLNMAVFASVVKWGGNAFLFAAAFCVGDRLVQAAKRSTLPAHDARTRTTVNYVAGLACAGAMVGVLPWWVLSDNLMAIRLATSGAVLGAGLGLVVGFTLQRLASTNLSRLDTSVRQLRRYEALMLRERKWAEALMEAEKGKTSIWW